MLPKKVATVGRVTKKETSINHAEVSKMLGYLKYHTAKAGSDADAAPFAKALRKYSSLPPSEKKTFLSNFKRKRRTCRGHKPSTKMSTRCPRRRRPQSSPVRCSRLRFQGLSDKKCQESANMEQPTIFCWFGVLPELACLFLLFCVVGRSYIFSRRPTSWTFARRWCSKRTSSSIMNPRGQSTEARA